MNTIEDAQLSQMQISEHEILRRNELLGLKESELDLLQRCRDFIAEEIDQIVEEFYQRQVGQEEVAAIIGDADTLRRLHKSQRQYVLDLFSGVITLDYVSNRLRIGLVHKRIGVEPKLYLSAMKLLKDVIYRSLCRNISDPPELDATYQALDKLLHFDLTLVFDTYIGSLVDEVESARKRIEAYAKGLELQVADRTRELNEKVAQLEAAMATVKKLEGVIPICSCCKKIRDDKESWQQMEKYISEHSEAMFSHGLCPECYERELSQLKKWKAPKP